MFLQITKNLCQGLIVEMSDIKVAVISDIHGNADALKSVLDKIKLLVPDITIILGDLLTYGCEPLDVLDVLNTYKESNQCVFIKGNHDQFYFDLESGKKSFEYSIPEFVSESIFWTVNELNGIKFTLLGTVFINAANS